MCPVALAAPPDLVLVFGANKVKIRCMNKGTKSTNLTSHSPIIIRIPSTSLATAIARVPSVLRHLPDEQRVGFWAGGGILFFSKIAPLRTVVWEIYFKYVSGFLWLAELLLEIVSLQKDHADFFALPVFKFCNKPIVLGLRSKDAILSVY